MTDVLDHDRRGSCGHTYTLRHVACPVCFSEARYVLGLGEKAILHDGGPDAFKAFVVALAEWFNPAIRDRSEPLPDPDRLREVIANFDHAGEAGDASDSPMEAGARAAYRHAARILREDVLKERS